MCATQCCIAGSSSFNAQGPTHCYNLMQHRFHIPSNRSQTSVLRQPARSRLSISKSASFQAPATPGSLTRPAATALPQAAAAAAGPQGQRQPARPWPPRRLQQRARPRGRACRAAARPAPPACAPSCPAGTAVKGFCLTGPAPPACAPSCPAGQAELSQVWVAHALFLACSSCTCGISLAGFFIHSCCLTALPRQKEHDPKLCKWNSITL